MATIAGLLILTGCNSQADQAEEAKKAEEAQIPVPEIDLSQERKLSDKVEIGKTSLKEMEAIYGAAVEKSTIKSTFCKNLASDNGPYPEIEQHVAFIKMEPINGGKWEMAYPYNFTVEQEPELVGAQIMLKRGDLQEKIKANTLTMDDIKRVYGEPTRDLGQVIEYYDFKNKTVLQVFVQEGNQFNTMLTDYGVLYKNLPEDLKEHESIVKRLSREEAMKRKEAGNAGK